MTILAMVAGSWLVDVMDFGWGFRSERVDVNSSTIIARKGGHNQRQYLVKDWSLGQSAERKLHFFISFLWSVRPTAVMHSGNNNGAIAEMPLHCQGGTMWWPYGRNAYSSYHIPSRLVSICKQAIGGMPMIKIKMAMVDTEVNVGDSTNDTIRRT